MLFFCKDYKILRISRQKNILWEKKDDEIFSKFRAIMTVMMEN